MQAASATNEVDEDDEDALLAEEATEEADVVEALLAEETDVVARRTILPILSAPHK